MKREVETDTTRTMKKKLKALKAEDHKPRKIVNVVVSSKQMSTRKKITEDSFEIWYSENKSSLSQDYIEYVYETRQASDTPLFLKAWAKTVYDSNRSL